MNCYEEQSPIVMTILFTFTLNLDKIDLYKRCSLSYILDLYVCYVRKWEVRTFGLTSCLSSSAWCVAQWS